MSEPLNVIACDQPTKCVLCGTRTELTYLGEIDKAGGVFDKETCPACGQVHHVYQDDDCEDES